MQIFITKNSSPFLTFGTEILADKHHFRVHSLRKAKPTLLVFTTRLPDTAAYMVGDKIILECETANEAMQCRWTQNGRDLANSKHVKITNNGTLRQITIDACTLSDDSMFR